MPPWPMKERISNWGNNSAKFSREGGVNLACFEGSAPPVSVPKPAFIRHSGQTPCGASKASCFPQLGHIRAVFIQILSFSTDQFSAKGYTEFAEQYPLMGGEHAD